MTIRILQMNNDFQPLGKALPKPAEKAPEAVQIKPGIWRNPGGKLETRDSVTAPLHPPKKQMPNAVTQEGDMALLCGGWVEWRPGMTLPTAWIDIRLTACDGRVEAHEHVLAQAYPEAIFTWPQNSLYMRCTAYRPVE